jgi:hypothetical protein
MRVRGVSGPGDGARGGVIVFASQRTGTVERQPRDGSETRA